MLLDGEDITDLPPYKRAIAELGRSFQEARLFPSLSVADDGAGVARDPPGEPRAGGRRRCACPPRPTPSATAAERVDELIELLGLGRYRDTPTGDLSTGTRRIVELACLLGQDPAVLLLDEPSAGIAQRETEALGPLLRDVQSETGCSIVVIEHDMALLSALCDDFVALEQGGVIASGRPDRGAGRPRVISSYLGTNEDVVARSGERRDARRASVEQFAVPGGAGGQGFGADPGDQWTETAYIRLGRARHAPRGVRAAGAERPPRHAGGRPWLGRPAYVAPGGLRPLRLEPDLAARRLRPFGLGRRVVAACGSRPFGLGWRVVAACRLRPFGLGWGVVAACRLRPFGWDGQSSPPAGYDRAGWDGASSPPAGYDRSGWDGVSSPPAGHDRAGWDGQSSPPAGYDRAGWVVCRRRLPVTTVGVGMASRRPPPGTTSGAGTTPSLHAPPGPGRVAARRPRPRRAGIRRRRRPPATNARAGPNPLPPTRATAARAPTTGSRATPGTTRGPRPPKTTSGPSPTGATPGTSPAVAPATPAPPTAAAAGTGSPPPTRPAALTRAGTRNGRPGPLRSPRPGFVTVAPARCAHRGRARRSRRPGPLRQGAGPRGCPGPAGRRCVQAPAGPRTSSAHRGQDGGAGAGPLAAAHDVGLLFRLVPTGRAGARWFTAEFGTRRNTNGNAWPGVAPSAAERSGRLSRPSGRPPGARPGDRRNRGLGRAGGVGTRRAVPADGLARTDGRRPRRRPGPRATRAPATRCPATRARARAPRPGGPPPSRPPPPARRRGGRWPTPRSRPCGPPAGSTPR